MSGRLKGKVAIITGAGSGMGRAGALRFTAEGAAVVLADRNEQAAKEVEAEVAAAGGTAVHIAADVTSSTDMEHTVGLALEQFGQLDVLYNNAGIGPVEDAAIHELDEAVFDLVMSVNVRGVYLASKQALRAMLAQGTGGSIVNAASIAGFKGNSTVPASAYTVSKAAVMGMTKQIAASYASDGIRCNAVCPGPIDTPILAPWFEEDGAREAFEQMVPLGRIGRPDDVASLALFLASDESSFITGALIVIDGGILAA